jgi:hypothetical protein
MISMTIDEFYLRRSVQALLQAGAEQDAVRRKSKCGRACDLADFEPKLAELVRERT